MGVFSKLSASKKHAQKLQDEKKQKEKATDEPKPKYMHTPKHAYVDALNSTCGTTPANTRQYLREAAERRKSRMSRNNSYPTMSGLHSVHSASTQLTTMSSWEARKAMAYREQLQRAATPVATAPVRKEYQSSPLASVGEPSTAGPSTVSSYERLEMASLAPLPLRPSFQKSRSPQKKSVTIQAPAKIFPEPSQTSPTFDDLTDASPVNVIEPSYAPVTMIQPACEPLGKTTTVNSAEVRAETSSEEEKEKEIAKGKKKSSLFWRRRRVPVAAIAA